MDVQKSSYNAEDIKNNSIDPLKDGISSLTLLRVSGSDIDIVNAARVSFGKFVTVLSDRDKKLIYFLMKHKHTSPFEHTQLSFRVKAPIFVVRQWMRHRMNSYNELSARYAQVPLEFYVPCVWRKQDKINKQASIGSFSNESLKKEYESLLKDAGNLYEKMLQQGITRELARGVLPVCTYTQFIYTCNVHSLFHFLGLRLKKDAQYEIQMYAQGLFDLAKLHFPVAFSAWQELYMQ